MAVTLSVFLFGKPGQELNEGGPITAPELRDLAQHMHARLVAIAEIVEKLTNAGWEAQMGLYDINLYHPYVSTEAQAEEKLQDLGIDSDMIHIDEWEDEEWENEENGEFNA
jgi:hypothetical protein